MAAMPLGSHASRLQGEDCCPLIPHPIALKYIPIVTRMRRGTRQCHTWWRPKSVTPIITPQHLKIIMFSTLLDDDTALPGMKHMPLWGKLSRSRFAVPKPSHSFGGSGGEPVSKGQESVYKRRDFICQDWKVASLGLPLRREQGGALSNKWDVSLISSSTSFVPHRKVASNSLIPCLCLQQSLGFGPQQTSAAPSRNYQEPEGKKPRPAPGNAVKISPWCLFPTVLLHFKLHRTETHLNHKGT